MATAALVPALFGAVASSLLSKSMTPKVPKTRATTVPQAAPPGSQPAIPGSQAEGAKGSTAGSAAPTAAEIAADTNNRKRRGRLATILTGVNSRLQGADSGVERLGG